MDTGLDSGQALALTTTFLLCIMCLFVLLSVSHLNLISLAVDLHCNTTIRYDTIEEINV